MKIYGRYCIYTAYLPFIGTGKWSKNVRRNTIVGIGGRFNANKYRPERIVSRATLCAVYYSQAFSSGRKSEGS